MPKACLKRLYGLFAIQLVLVGAFTGTMSFVQANPGTPPEYRYDGPPDGTSVVLGENITLYAQGYSDIGLSWAWLSTNETGTWANYTRLWSDWQASESNPIIDGDIVFGSGYVTEDSKILKVRGSYYVFIASGSTQSVMEIYMMNSSSLTGPWSLMNNSSPIIPRSTSGWDQSNLRVSSVMYYDGIYYLYYMGTDAGGKQHIGVVTTSDAEFPDGWTKYGSSPILSPTGTGWESGGIYSLDLLRIGPTGNEWYGHYTATDKTGPGGGYWSVGICYGASPYGPFTRHASNPILQRGIGQWDNLGLPRTDLVLIGNTIYGAYEAASTTSPWDFQVGEYSGEINGDILSVVFSKNPNNPIIAGDAGSATQSANPCWWYENETRHMLAGGGIPSPYRWRYIDLFESSLIKRHGSPLEMYNVSNSWTWANFTWSSSDVPLGTTIQWMIYFVDTEGNVSGTAIHSFNVEAPEYDFVDLDTSDVDGNIGKGTHSNFLYEKACDSNFDTLTEEMAGDFGSMSYRKNLTINHNYVDGDQTGFPVLIDFYDTDLYSKVQTSGNDIAFTDSSGNKLDHEIEYFDRNYNDTHAHLVAWIRANLSDTSDTTICMLYGNPTIGSQQNPEGVWDGSYQGVWHLPEDASGVGTTDLYKDSTLNNNDGDDQVSATGKAGRIDGGQDFDGADDYIRVDDSPGLGLDNNALLEAWIKPSLLTGYQVILRKAPNNALMDFPQENYGIFLHDDEIYFEFYSGGTYRYHETTSANLQTGNWYYLVVVYDNMNDRVRIYLNNNSILDQAQTNALVDYADTHLRIGDRYVDNGQHFHGYIDEVRISNTTRSASWTNTTYQNVYNMVNFLSIGSEELPVSPATYLLDLEIQWTNVNYTRTYEELRITTGAFSGSEDIQVRIWNSTDNSWNWIMNLTANQSNNVPIGSCLTESTLTVQFLGGTETGDTSQDSWDIGCALIRTWSTPDPATLSVSTVGSGSVNLNNTGPYYYGDVVELTAVPDAGWSFEGWSSDLSGSANPTTIVLDGNKTVTATFTQNNYTLSVSIIGSGSVNLNNSGPYYYGDIVELTANASTGWSFDRWNGDLSGSANPTTILIDGNKTVTAYFIVAGTHDVAVVDVKTSKTIVGQGDSMTINVTVENRGEYRESFNVTVYCNATVIGRFESIILSQGNQTILTLTWKAIGVAKGNYTISAYAWPVPGETDTADNTYIFGNVTVAMTGDIIVDGIVDIYDLIAVAGWFGSPVPPAPANYDVIEDRIIDIYDVSRIATHYGEVDP